MPYTHTETSPRALVLQNNGGDDIPETPGARSSAGDYFGAGPWTTWMRRAGLSHLAKAARTAWASSVM